MKSGYGSHSTLRIGRPEFKTFDTVGTRAWQLLDLFSAGDFVDNNLTSPQVSTKGKININTARIDVLRSLGAGIQIGNLNSNDVDQDIHNANGSSTVYGPTATKAADLLADSVLAYRASQPFISTSQLAQLTATDKNGNANQPLFGNPDQWLNGDGPKVESVDQTTLTGNGNTAGVIDWNDGASEQYFAKMYNFTTVRSRNFRVFVTGQYVDPNTNDPYTGTPPRVIATANKVYEVFLKPTRDSRTGAITDQTCVVTYQADVP